MISVYRTKKHYFSPVTKFLSSFLDMNFSHESYTEKTKRLNEMSAKHPVIKLDTFNFNDYVLTPEKDYSFIVLFTPSIAEDQIYPQYLAVAKSKEFLDKKSEFFFGFVDVEKEPEIFESVKMCYRRDTGMIITKKSPMLMHFAHSRSLTHSDYIDLEHIQIEDVGDMLLTFIKTSVGTPPNAMDSKIIYAWHYISGYLHDKHIWACTIIGFCIMNISGENWTVINNAGLLFTMDGENFYVIAPGKRQQSLLECYFVMFLILLCVCGMLLVIESMRSIKCRKEKRRTINTKLIIGTVLMLGTFSFLNFLFQIKISVPVD